MGDEVLKSHHFLLTILFYTNILWSAQATLSLGNEVKVYDQIFEKISENQNQTGKNIKKKNKSLFKR